MRATVSIVCQIRATVHKLVILYTDHDAVSTEHHARNRYRKSLIRVFKSLNCLFNQSDDTNLDVRYMEQMLTAFCLGNG